MMEVWKGSSTAATLMQKIAEVLNWTYIGAKGEYDVIQSPNGQLKLGFSQTTNYGNTYNRLNLLYSDYSSASQITNNLGGSGAFFVGKDEFGNIFLGGGSTKSSALPVVVLYNYGTIEDPKYKIGGIGQGLSETSQEEGIKEFSSHYYLLFMPESGTLSDIDKKCIIEPVVYTSPDKEIVDTYHLKFTNNVTKLNKYIIDGKTYSCLWTINGTQSEWGLISEISNIHDQA